tara:strand:- start:308 stop:1291 length:984 start_codon:yes stop_codon:yes gene_type:complete
MKNIMHEKSQGINEQNEPLDRIQMQTFEDDGAVLVDLRLNPDLLDRAEAAWDRFDKAEDSTPQSIFEDPDYVELISAPVFEQIAKQVLRSDRVFILETGRAGTGLGRTDANDKARRNEWPEKHGVRSEWANSMHIDVQVTTEDFEATPRREHLAIWFWLNDVPDERAAMRVLKGSHKSLGAHWQEMQQRWKADPNASLPRRCGPRWEAEGEPDARFFAGLEPTAMAAPRGHAQVFSQSLLHAGWHSDDTEPRKGFHISWVADEVSIGGMCFNDQSGRIDSVRERSAKLRKVMDPKRRHVAMDAATLERLVDLWEEEWPPTLRQRFRL